MLAKKGTKSGIIKYYVKHNQCTRAIGAGHPYDINYIPFSTTQQSFKDY